MVHTEDLCVCVCVCVYIYIYIYIYIYGPHRRAPHVYHHTRIQTYIHTCVSIYSCITYIHRHTHIHAVVSQIYKMIVNTCSRDQPNKAPPSCIVRAPIAMAPGALPVSEVRPHGTVTLRCALCGSESVTCDH